MTSRITILAFAALIATTPAHGQSVFAGRVLTDSGVAINGAEVFMNGPQNIQRTNERGEFRFTAVPAGFQVIGVRMTGFNPKVDTIEVGEAGDIRREYKLVRIETTLPRVPVTAPAPVPAKLVEFYERRQLGAGRFLDSLEWANSRGTRTSDRLSRLPGLLIQRGRGSEMFVTNTRVRRPGEPGARSMCRAMVWLDGVNLGVEFNVNQLDPSTIAAVEWYASSLSVPAKLAAQPRFAANATGPTVEGYCGVLVIWTR